MLENVRISIRGILSHKLRSFLTMLGIIIGIAAIIAIVSTIQGTNEQIKNNLIGSGNNAVSVKLYQDGYEADFSYSEVPAGIPIFDKSIIEEIEKLDGVESASLLRARRWTDGVYLDNSYLSCSVYGVDSDYFTTAGLEVIKGEGFSRKDLNGTTAVCIVDKNIAEGFDGDTIIGNTLDIQGNLFTVIGIVREKSQFEPVINSPQDYYTYMGDDSNGIVYIPDGMWQVAFRYDEPYNVILRAKSTDDMTAAGKGTEDLLNSYITDNQTPNGGKIEYKSEDLVEEASQLQQLSQSTNTMLIGIASISLLVGGIGVMNIMLVSVTERTREIGLKKALGARRKTILGQFLTEAALLSVFGGILGVVAGIILSQVIARVAQVPVSISTPAILIAVGFSIAVGIIFGLAPSVKASNLNPIDALRYE